MDDKQYAFLMINYDTPQLIREIWDQLNDDELYISDEYPDSYGIERHTHVTLVPCLSCDTDINQLRRYLRPLHEYALLLTNVSVFSNNENYDVLKCDVVSDILMETNKRITADFPTFSEYKEYHPHMTVAYINKGCSNKYLKDVVLPLVVLKPTSFWYTFFDKEGNRQEYRFA